MLKNKVSFSRRNKTNTCCICRNSWWWFWWGFNWCCYTMWMCEIWRRFCCCCIVWFIKTSFSIRFYLLFHSFGRFDVPSRKKFVLYIFDNHERWFFFSYRFLSYFCERNSLKRSVSFGSGENPAFASYKPR